MNQILTAIAKKQRLLKPFNLSFSICFNCLILLHVHVNWILLCVIVDLFKFHYQQKLCNRCYSKISEHEIITRYKFGKWNAGEIGNREPADQRGSEKITACGNF